MPSPTTLAAAVLLSAGLVGAWMQNPGNDHRREAMTSPVAALAWAQLRCDPGLEMAPGTPRIQAEDLMLVSAAFDAETQRRGTAAVCAEALAIAARVAEANPGKR